MLLLKNGTPSKDNAEQENTSKRHIEQRAIEQDNSEHRDPQRENTGKENIDRGNIGQDDTEQANLEQEHTEKDHFRVSQTAEDSDESSTSTEILFLPSISTDVKKKWQEKSQQDPPSPILSHNGRWPSPSSTSIIRRYNVSEPDNASMEDDLRPLSWFKEHSSSESSMSIRRLSVSEIEDFDIQDKPLLVSWLENDGEDEWLRRERSAGPSEIADVGVFHRHRRYLIQTYNSFESSDSSSRTFAYFASFARRHSTSASVPEAEADLENKGRRARDIEPYPFPPPSSPPSRPARSSSAPLSQPIARMPPNRFSVGLQASPSRSSSKAEWEDALPTSPQPPQADDNETDEFISTLTPLARELIAAGVPWKEVVAGLQPEEDTLPQPHPPQALRSPPPHPSRPSRPSGNPGTDLNPWTDTYTQEHGRPQSRNLLYGSECEI